MGYRLIEERQRMTPQEWEEVPDNPRQRDTERHLHAARYLRKFDESQRLVNMGYFIDDGGTRHDYKLDGHTRSLAWKQNPEIAPDHVKVDVWHCDTIEDVKILYKRFDFSKAAEGSIDQVAGAYREFGLEFESEVLRSLKISAALITAFRMLHGSKGIARKGEIDTYALVRYWAPELMLIDSFKPTRSKFRIGVLTAALLTFYRYGEKASDFWTAHNLSLGEMGNGEMDMVQALHEKMNVEKMQDVSGPRQKWGEGTIYNVVCVCLPAYEKYQKGQRVKARGKLFNPYTISQLNNWLAEAVIYDRHKEERNSIVPIE